MAKITAKNVFNEIREDYVESQFKQYINTGFEMTLFYWFQNHHNDLFVQLTQGQFKKIEKMIEEELDPLITEKYDNYLRELAQEYIEWNNNRENLGHAPGTVSLFLSQMHTNFYLTCQGSCLPTIESYVKESSILV